VGTWAVWKICSCIGRTIQRRVRYGISATRWIFGRLDRDGMEFLRCTDAISSNLPKFFDIEGSVSLLQLLLLIPQPSPTGVLKELGLPLAGRRPRIINFWIWSL